MTGHGPAAPQGPPCFPVALRLDPLAAMANAELSDEVYDGVELQWFDDEVHGTGMLAFLSRREDRRVDYYVQRGLRLDPGGYEIGGGLRSWNETDFDVAHLDVHDDGLAASVRFSDVDGRRVDVELDDRDGRPRRRANLLAPVSAAIDRPRALLVVWMPGFDLLRAQPGRRPMIRIDGRDAPTGRLPGERLHRRHLVKYAAPLCSVELNRDGDLAPGAARTDHVGTTPDGTALRTLTATGGAHTAVVTFEPPLPDVRLGDGERRRGRWRLAVDGARVIGGTWSVAGSSDAAEVALDVDAWRPGRLPWLVRVVTTVVPVFRRWPTTYAWRGTVPTTGPAVVTGCWSRTGGHDGSSYRRATGGG